MPRSQRQEVARLGYQICESRVLPGKLPAEIGHLIDASGFLSSKDVGWFLLQTQKPLTKEIQREFMWKTIMKSHFANFDADKSRLNQFVKALGSEWVFPHLLREPMQAPPCNTNPW